MTMHMRVLIVSVRAEQLSLQGGGADGYQEDVSRNLTDLKPIFFVF